MYSDYKKKEKSQYDVKRKKDHKDTYRNFTITFTPTDSDIVKLLDECPSKAKALKDAFRWAVSHGWMK
jgi:hypothetical protein